MKDSCDPPILSLSLAAMSIYHGEGFEDAGGFVARNMGGFEELTVPG